MAKGNYRRRGAVALVVAVIAVLCLPASHASAKEVTLLNASYDPTREFYQDINAAFARHWREQTGDTVTVRQSHGGSGKQARAVIDGLYADVVTLALAYDVDALCQRAKLIPADWQTRLPNHSAPYTSTIVFLVRGANPKGIRDWDDLAKPGIAVVTPNPRSSGGARWNYLAAWGYALKKWNGDETKALDYMIRFFRNVAILDAGARGAKTSFVQRDIGDVLVAWESEALVTLKECEAGRFKLVIPSVSILAEPPVTWVDKVVNKRGTRAVAQAYLEFLYTAEGQEIAAKHCYRPRLESVRQKYAATFPKVDLFTVDELFGGWQKAHQAHFAEGGMLDKIQKANR